MELGVNWYDVRVSEKYVQIITLISDSHCIIILSLQGFLSRYNSRFYTGFWVTASLFSFLVLFKLFFIDLNNAVVCVV